MSDSIWVPRGAAPSLSEVARSMSTIKVDCDRPQNPNVQFVTCEKCHKRYAIHCEDCKFQITGCTCTMKRKIEESSAETPN